MNNKFEIPSLRPTPRPLAAPEVGSFGVVDTLRTGLVNRRSDLTLKHPLEQSELLYDLNQHRIKFGMARKVCGAALPLTLQAERMYAANIKRLPGIKSSNLHLEVFLGVDEDLTIEDVFDRPSPWEDLPKHPRSTRTA